MRLRPAVLVLVVACAAVLVSASPAAPATSQPEPVPSLEPEATRALWERLSRRTRVEEMAELLREIAAS